ncbi:telomere repeat-binding factor 2-like [Juglans microcarpa x Juglans regia]|uniref:telomere repeat-binding factor 2-like n=1 Tax=Juglans microcarpa x Juglans regia TaxID=2249226 RepID=UPI001B7F45A4|nr:telomere repeat-binding factor 2-like [Juglans microcarpa x Juglans regia]
MTITKAQSLTVRTSFTASAAATVHYGENVPLIREFSNRRLLLNAYCIFIAAIKERAKQKKKETKGPPKIRLDKLIVESITNLKEPRGSDRAAIALYIEERYWAPPNLKKLLSTKLKHMTENGRLNKIKHKYKMAPILISSEKRRSSSLLLLEERQKDTLKAQKREINVLTKAQVDAELMKMKGMTAQEAAAAAAQAVAEAEVTIREADMAAREVEVAAEAEQIFAKAAMKALKCGTLRAW